MKKTLKIFLITIFTFFIFSIGKSVNANSINKISMDIYIDSNGNAQVTEVWNCNTTEGTEVYHPYYNLGNSKITNLTVSDENNTYETLSKWNTSGSLSSKAYKCGINTISNGVELCWGISEYSHHTYTVKYDISNFVSSLTDSQMLYWTLIPYDFSNNIGSVYIKIHTNFYIPDSVGVWGYGNYGGTAYVYNGCIEMQSDGRLYSNEYMTILVQFPAGTFNCSNQIDNSFNYYLNMAEEGATHYVSSTSAWDKLFSILSIVFTIFFTIFPILIIALVSKISTVKNNLAGAKLPRDIPYYRDIPCNSDLYRAYYIGYKYNIIKNKTDILGAIILKWLKEGKINITTVETGKIAKKSSTAVVLNQNTQNTFDDSIEQNLFNMLVSASGDGILESKEFEKWCSKNYSKILSWFDKLINNEEEKLVSGGLVKVTEEKIFKVFKCQKHSSTDELQKQAIELAGLKKFLLDYSLIADRTAIEVKLFEDYLIYSQMIGIAKAVAKQFKNLYPDIIEESAFYSYDNIIFINTCSNHGITQANNARAIAENYSSGGGGFSSGGGGGGSFGGGGGGGGFR